MSNAEIDKDPELGKLYDADPVDVPSLELDAAVQKIAREKSYAKAQNSQAVQKKPNKLINSRWVGAFSAAAVVLISVGVLLSSPIGQQAGQQAGGPADGLESKQSENDFSGLETAKMQNIAEQRVQAEDMPGQLKFKKSATPKYLAPAEEASQVASADTADANERQSQDASISRRREVAALPQAEVLAMADSQPNAALGGNTDAVPRPWIQNKHLAPAIEILHPQFDQHGDTVNVRTTAERGVLGLHLYSHDRNEIYVEVVVYPQAINIEQAYAAQKMFIEQGDPRKLASQVASLKNTFVIEQPAQQAKVTFQENVDGVTKEFERRFYFLNVSHADETHGLRIVVDPRSPTNFEILKRLELYPTRPR